MVAIRDASELMNQFFQDIEYVLKPALSNVYPMEFSEAKDRISDFISNYGDSLFLVDVREVSEKRMFLRRRLFEMGLGKKNFVRVFQNELDKETIVAAINEEFATDGIAFPRRLTKEADAQFIIGLRSLVSQIYDRFCSKGGD